MNILIVYCITINYIIKEVNYIYYIMDFEILYDYWFSNKNLWFNSNLKDDIEITRLFEYLFSVSVDEEKLKTNSKYGIGVVLLYDQVSRHILRSKNEDFLYFWPRETFINETNKLAIKYSIGVYFYFKYDVNADEYAFIMLPLRHSCDFKKIKYVMSETWLKLKEETRETELGKYKQFIKATYERAIIQSNDEIYIKKYLKSDDEEKSDEYINLKKLELCEKYNKILGYWHNTMIDDSIDLDLVSQYKKQVINNLSSNFIKNINKIGESKFILSISGGVDSMVCAIILKKANIPYSCVHINYSNRKESVDEENFVIEWCNILNVDLYVRKIDEINRPECMKYNLRNLYESYTRDVRYGTYLKVNSIISSTPYVILGHNQDDCFENIMTNIAHKSKYENLHGMELVTAFTHLKQKINFVRPMLDIKKRSIYEFATVANIPFLWDSTPKWSQRGKIRDEVRPVLESWDDRLVSGLFEVSNVLRESLEMIDIMVSNWIGNIKENKIICKINTVPASKTFWKKLFYAINIKCSIRSLDGYIDFIKKIKDDKNKIDINSCIRYEINKDYQIKIMKIKDENVNIFFNNKK